MKWQASVSPPLPPFNWPSGSSGPGRKNGLTDDLRKEIKQPGRKWRCLLVCLFQRDSWWRKLCVCVCVWCGAGAWKRWRGRAVPNVISMYEKRQGFLSDFMRFFFAFATQTSSGSPVVGLDRRLWAFSIQICRKSEKNGRNGNKRRTSL